MPFDECKIKHLSALELFLIRGTLVASQPAYTHPYMKETYHEVRHFYCPKCGERWGTRTKAQLPISLFKYYSKPCNSCGGKEAWSMLIPFEQRRLELLGPNVLAFLFLEASEGITHDR